MGQEFTHNRPRPSGWRVVPPDCLGSPKALGAFPNPIRNSGNHRQPSSLCPVRLIPDNRFSLASGWYVMSKLAGIATIVFMLVVILGPGLFLAIKLIGA
jgi:hypothetical protein